MLLCSKLKLKINSNYRARVDRGTDEEEDVPRRGQHEVSDDQPQEDGGRPKLFAFAATFTRPNCNSSFIQI